MSSFEQNNENIGETTPPPTGKTCKQDLYETSPDSVRAILHLLEPFKGQKTIIDPCCGNDTIVNILQDHGHTAIGYDILKPPDYVNYLTDKQPESNRVVVMHPPCGLRRAFISKAYSDGLPFLAYIPLSSIGSVSMAQILSVNGCETHLVVGLSKHYYNGKCVPAGEMVWIGGNFSHIEQRTQSFQINFIGQQLIEDLPDTPISASSVGTLFDTYPETRTVEPFISLNPMYRPVSFDPEEEIDEKLAFSIALPILV